MNTPQDKDLSLNKLSAKIKLKIYKKLNIRGAIAGDFRDFAAELDMATDDLNTISTKENPTEEIFKWWEPKKEATVNNLRKILEKMERHDLIDILNDDPKVQALADVKNGNLPSGEENHTALPVANTENAKCHSGEELVDGLPAVDTGVTPSPPSIKVVELSDMHPARIDWQQALRKEIDVLAIAVNDKEFRTVYEILPEPEVADSGTNLGEAYFGTIGENRVALVTSGMGAGGKTGIQATLIDALRELKPKVVICVGVCYGMNKGKQKYADVLVSKKLATYASHRKNSDGSVYYRGPIHECDGRLVKLFSNKMGWKGPCPGQISPDVHSGLIISGPELIDNKDRKEQLQEEFNEALGGEMEGEGLYNICENLNVPWIVVKAICDWADGKKDKEWQLCAGAVAASLVEHVLTKNYVPKREKRKSDGPIAQEPSPKKARPSTHM